MRQRNVVRRLGSENLKQSKKKKKKKKKNPINLYLKPVEIVIANYKTLCK
jgi:hypothetical protein